MDQHYVLCDIKITEFFQPILSHDSGWESTNSLLCGHKNVNWFSLPTGIGVVVVYLLGNWKLGARAMLVYSRKVTASGNKAVIVLATWWSSWYFNNPIGFGIASVELNGMCLTCNILVFSSNIGLYTSSWDQYCLGRGRRWAVKPPLCTSLLD